MLYGRMVLIMIIGLYSSRLVLKALGIEDYGIYNLIGGVVMFFSVINSAMLSATQRFLNFGIGQEDIAYLKRIFHVSFIIHSIIAVIVIILVEIGGLWLLYNKLQIPFDRFRAAIFVFQTSVISLAIQIITVPYSAVIVSHERMSTVALVSIIQFVLNFLASLFITFSNGDRLKLYALLIALIQIVIALYYYIYCRLHFKEVKGKASVDKNLLKEMSQFAGWCMVGCTAGILYTQGLNILLGIFFLPMVNAARGIAVVVQNSINQVWTNVQIAMVPQLIQSYAKNDMNYFLSLLMSSSKYYVYLLLIVALPIFIRTDYILTLWLGEVPPYTVIMIRILLGVSIIDAISAPLMRSSDATGDIKKYHILVGGVLLTIVPIAYLVLKLGGKPESVFYVYLIVSCVALVTRLVILRQKIPLSVKVYFSKVILPIILVIAISYPICDYISNCIQFTFGGLIIFCIITTVIIGLLVFFIGIGKQERTFVKRKVKNLILRRQ